MLSNELDDRCANRRFLTIFSISLDIKERFAIGMQLHRSSLLREDFLTSGLTSDDFRGEGKVPVRKERFTMD